MNPRGLVKYDKDQKSAGSYLDIITRRSKAIPDPCKYSKIIKWSTDTGNRGKFSTSKRVTFLTEVAKKAKGVPGPN